MTLVRLMRCLLSVPVLLMATTTIGVAQPSASAVTHSETLKLSVEQVALLTLQHNRDLQIRRLEPVIAATFEDIERSVFDPELFVELEYTKERTSETSRSSGTRYDVDGHDSEAIAGIRQYLPTGTTLEATVEQSRSISNRSPEQQQARVGLTMTQALLQGLGPAVNLANVRQSELGTVASRFELRGFTEAVLAEAETAYWNFVLAEEQIAIFERSLEVARQQRDETELRIEVGLLPEVEAAATRAEVARREQALIDARSQLKERRLHLLRLLDPDDEDSYDRHIVTTSNPRTEAKPLQDLAERLQLAEKMRPDLNQARLQLQQQQLEIAVTRNGLLPRLDFFITLGKTGYADTFTDAFEKLDGKTYDLTAGLNFSYALGNREAKARHQGAMASQKQAHLAIDNLKHLVRLDVRLAANELERARQQTTASTTTRALQEETLAAEQERFEVGASTTLLVAQAQRDLLASQIAEVEAIINYRIALVNLYLAEGSLLERRGIQVGN